MAAAESKDAAVCSWGVLAFRESVSLSKGREAGELRGKARLQA